MVLHNGGQGGLVGDRANPGWQLRVPNQSVAANEFAIGSAPVDEVVSLGERKDTTRSLGGVPLHAVLLYDGQGDSAYKN